MRPQLPHLKSGLFHFKKYTQHKLFFPFDISKVANTEERTLVLELFQSKLPIWCSNTLKYFNVYFLQTRTFLPYNHNTIIKTEKSTLLH